MITSIYKCLVWFDSMYMHVYMQGVLDEQFLQLQQLQDEASPNFVSEVVNIYFHESEKLLNNLRGLLYVINLLLLCCFGFGMNSPC